jgi:hypothetical protein
LLFAKRGKLIRKERKETQTFWNPQPLQQRRAQQHAQHAAADAQHGVEADVATEIDGGRPGERESQAAACKRQRAWRRDAQCGAEGRVAEERADGEGDAGKDYGEELGK